MRENECNIDNGEKDGRKKKKEEGRGISLKKALSVIKCHDTFCIYKESQNPTLYREVYDRAKIIQKFDLKKTMVVEIKPYFVCNEFEGFTLILKD